MLFFRRLYLDRPETLRIQSDLHSQLKLVWPRLDFVELTRDICDLAGQIAPFSRLRSLDAIHLASYYKLKRYIPDLKMITFDKRILEELESPQ